MTIEIIATTTKGRWILCNHPCLFVWARYLKKVMDEIQRKFGGPVGWVTRTNWLDFGEDQDPDLTIFLAILHNWEMGPKTIYSTIFQNTVDRLWQNLVDELWRWQEQANYILVRATQTIFFFFWKPLRINHGLIWRENNLSFEKKPESVDFRFCQFRHICNPYWSERRSTSRNSAGWAQIPMPIPVISDWLFSEHWNWSVGIDPRRWTEVMYSPIWLWAQYPKKLWTDFTETWWRGWVCVTD